MTLIKSIGKYNILCFKLKIKVVIVPLKYIYCNDKNMYPLWIRTTTSSFLNMSLKNCWAIRSADFQNVELSQWHVPAWLVDQRRLLWETKGNKLSTAYIQTCTRYSKSRASVAFLLGPHWLSLKLGLISLLWISLCSFFPWLINTRDPCRSEILWPSCAAIPVWPLSSSLISLFLPIFSSTITSTQGTKCSLSAKCAPTNSRCNDEKYYLTC